MSAVSQRRTQCRDARSARERGGSGDLDFRHSAEQIAEFITVELGDRSDPVEIANQTALGTMKRPEADCPSGATQEAVLAREPQLHDVRRRPIFFQKRGDYRTEDVARFDRLQFASTTTAKVLGYSDAVLNHAGLNVGVTRTQSITSEHILH